MGDRDFFFFLPLFFYLETAVLVSLFRFPYMSCNFMPQQTNRNDSNNAEYNKQTNHDMCMP